MRRIFVTHKHIDHLLGIVWMMRVICQSMGHGGYRGEAFIYSHAEVLELLRDMAGKLLRADDVRHIDERLHLVELTDGQTLAMYRAWVADGKRMPLDEAIEMAVGLVCNGASSP